MNHESIVTLVVVLGLLAGSGGAAAQTPINPAFTYQGQLKNVGSPVNGAYTRQMINLTGVGAQGIAAPGNPDNGVFPRGSRAAETPNTPAAPGDENWDDQFYNSAWSLNGGWVNVVAVDGWDVYVGGKFSDLAGDPRIDNIGRWNGLTQSWYPLGAGLNGQVTTIEVRPSGQIYAGGEFTQTGSLTVNRIAYYERGPDTWHAFGDGVDDAVGAIGFAANGDLLTGGRFTHAGGVTANNIARWDNDQWRPILSGQGNGLGGVVLALAATSTGFYAGGSFGGGILFYDQATQQWQALGAGSNAPVWDIELVGPQVYASGTFLQDGLFITGLARWDGVRWAQLGNRVDGSVRDILYFGGELFVAGGFAIEQGGVNYRSFARYDLNSHTWSGYGGGREVNGVKYIGPDNRVDSVAMLPNNDLVIGGPFYDVYQNDDTRLPGPRLVRWQAAYYRWAALNYGLNGGELNLEDHAIASDDKYIFADAGFYGDTGAQVHRIQRWDPLTESWANWGQALPGAVHDFLRVDGVLYAAGVYNTQAGERGFVASIGAPQGQVWTIRGEFDGGVAALGYFQDKLFAGGNFTTAGSAQANYIARLGDGGWEALDDGVSSRVTGLVADEDFLCVAGPRNAIGSAESFAVLRWNGLSWSGLAGPVGCDAESAIALHRSPGGLISELYTGNLSAVCHWDGAQWRSLGQIANAPYFARINKLLPLENGALVMGGRFQTVNGLAVHNLAAWNGSQWLAYGSGLTGGAEGRSEVFDLALSRYGLYLTGNFALAGARQSLGFARWAPQDAEFIVDNNGLTVYGLSDGVVYQMPPGVFPAPVRFGHRSLAASAAPPVLARAALVAATTASRLVATGVFFQATAVYSDTGAPASALLPYTVTVPYSDLQIFGQIESVLGLYRWDGQAWIKAPGSTVRLADNQVIATPQEFGTFALLTEPRAIYLPTVMR